MLFKIVLKNGVDFSIRAKECTTERSVISGELTSINFENIETKYCYPLFIDVNQISAVLQMGE